MAVERTSRLDLANPAFAEQVDYGRHRLGDDLRRLFGPEGVLSFSMVTSAATACAIGLAPLGS